MHGRSKVKNRAGERLRQRVEFFEPGRKLRDTDFRRRSSPPGRTGMIRLSISGHDLLVVTRLLSRIRSLNRCLGEKFSRRVSRGLDAASRRSGEGGAMLITDPLITRRASSVCPAAASAMNGAHQRRITTINRTSFHQRISSVILAGCILQIKRGGTKDPY